MFECPPMNRCRRCIIDHLNGFEHPPCYTCELKMRNIRICVVCFKSIKNKRQICDTCQYRPTKPITD